jgi:hypothetical protein
MSFKYPALLITLLCLNSQAYAFPLEIFENLSGNRIVAFLEESDIDAAASKWQPSEQTPPVTVQKLTRSIFEHMATEKGLENIEVEEIDLRPIPRHKEQWHYLVKMKVENNHEIEHRYFLVLMNGKIFPAIREPESIK